MGKTDTILWDASEHLNNPEAINEYLTAALEEGDTDLLIAALGDIARAKGMTQLAKETGLGRESLYKALTPGARPRFDTIMRVMRGLGIHLAAH